MRRHLDHLVENTEVLRGDLIASNPRFFKDFDSSEGIEDRLIVAFRVLAFRELTSETLIATKYWFSFRFLHCLPYRLEAGLESSYGSSSSAFKDKVLLIFPGKPKLKPNVLLCGTNSLGARQIEAERGVRFLELASQSNSFDAQA